MINKQILAQFRTNLQQYQIDDTKYALSLQFNQYDLNHLISTLLSSQGKSYQTFQFLIHNSLLRGNLKTHLSQLGITDQSVLQITFIPAHKKNDDWISSIGVCKQGCHPYIISLFSGLCSIFKDYQKPIYSQQIDDSALLCCKIITNADDFFRVILCSQEGKIFLYQYSENQFKKIAQANHCQGPLRSVDYYELNNQLICTGYKDIHIYRMKQKQETCLENNYNIHSLPINQIKWTSNGILSGGYDHTIKLFDLQKMKEKYFLLSQNHVFNCFQQINQLIISGNEDGYIRFFDPRTGSNPIKIQKSHSSWISVIKHKDNQSFIYVTAGYDNKVKLWDSRCSYSLQTIDEHMEKIFSGQWRKNQILIGGAESKVSVYSY